MPASKLTPELQLVVAVPGQYAFFRWQDVSIIVWVADATTAGVARLAELSAENERLFPAGVTAVHWVSGGVGLPSAEVRLALREIATRHRKSVHGVGVVLNGDGFWASALRGALTGVLMLGARAMPARFFVDAKSAAQWVEDDRVERKGVPVDAKILSDKIAQAVASAKKISG
jgi:hypothetical protein